MRRTAPGVAEVTRVPDRRDVGLPEAECVSRPSERDRGGGRGEVETAVRDQHDRHHQGERGDLPEPAYVDPYALEDEEGDARPEDDGIPGDDEEHRPQRNGAGDREGDQPRGDRDAVGGRIEELPEPG